VGPRHTAVVLMNVRTRAALVITATMQQVGESARITGDSHGAWQAGVLGKWLAGAVIWWPSPVGGV
jgi:hypothetical protein